MSSADAMKRDRPARSLSSPSTSACGGSSRVAQVKPGSSYSTEHEGWPNDCASCPRNGTSTAPCGTFASFFGLPSAKQHPGWTGKLVNCGSNGYKACFGRGFPEAGRMAHAWRKVRELWANHQSPLGGQALKFFGTLYDVEREVMTVSCISAAKSGDENKAWQPMHRTIG